MKKISRSLAAVAGAFALLGAGSASASASIITDGSWGGAHSTTSSYGVMFGFDATTTALLSLDLAGFKTLDGINDPWTDIFHLVVNGTEVLSGSFNMGGGGTSGLLSGSATWSTVTGGCSGPCTTNTGAGGSTHIQLPISLLSGDNTIKFFYTSPNGVQDTSDEAWGVKYFSVTAVPEPETYAMMLAGLGMVGAIARRRRKI